jgi:hypothetical protein
VPRLDCAGRGKVAVAGRGALGLTEARLGVGRLGVRGLGLGGLDVGVLGVGVEWVSSRHCGLS